METYAVFLRDIVNVEGEVIFEEGKRYLVRDETENNYYIQQIEGTNYVTEFPKVIEGETYKLSKRG